MDRPGVTLSMFKTPNGNPLPLYTRDGTADWNTCRASTTEDEYGVKGLSFQYPAVALDIGGYVGSFTAALLVDHPELYVVVVEPIPENVEMIRANLAGTHDRIIGGHVLHEAAVGVHGGEVTVRYDFEGDDGRVDDFAGQHRYVGNTSGFTYYSHDREHKTVTVPTLSIADLVPKGDIALCKIDCEGGEWLFLDDPDVARIALIVGEWHPNTGYDFGQAEDWVGDRDRLLSLLEPTHDVTFHGPQHGPGDFTAVRR